MTAAQPTAQVIPSMVSVAWASSPRGVLTISGAVVATLMTLGAFSLHWIKNNVVHNRLKVNSFERITIILTKISALL
jgi:hypothetical protein